MSLSKRGREAWVRVRVSVLLGPGPSPCPGPTFRVVGSESVSVLIDIKGEGREKMHVIE